MYSKALVSAALGVGYLPPRSDPPRSNESLQLGLAQSSTVLGRSELVRLLGRSLVLVEERMVSQWALRRVQTMQDEACENLQADCGRLRAR